MSSRSISAEVLRLLQRATGPLCLFDQERRLVFVNEACCDWLELPQERLLGQTGAYTSLTQKDGIAAVDRLCPPPEAFAGHRQSGYIYAASDTIVRKRRAEFVPLDHSDDGSPVPVMMLGGTSDEVDEVQDVTDTLAPAHHCDPDLLHERLIRFRHEQCARYRLESMVGDGAAIKLARSQAQAAIISRSSAVIVGPTGSGREHLARTIHYGTGDLAGDRTSARSHLLLPMDGSLVTGELLAGLVAPLSSAGRDAAATLLVVHADLVPPQMQDEILRLFGQRFSGVRFLATAEVSLDALVAEGRMRPEFAAAMSTIVIRLPPLADRRRDIPLLAQLVVEELNAERKKQIRGFTVEAMDALVAHYWPGNIAELRRFVAEAFAGAQGPDITAADLPRRLSHVLETAGRTSRAPETIVLHEFLTEIERELIERALRTAKGNKAKAARLLGLTRPRLYRRMVQLGLEEQPPIDAIAPRAARRSHAGSRRGMKPEKRPMFPAVPDGTDGVSNTQVDDEAEFIENIPFEEQPE